MDWRRWASIARLPIRKIVASMATENCFAENNYSSIANNIWLRLFSARSAIFCDLLEVTIFRQSGTAIRHCLCAAKAIPMNGAPS